MTNAPRRDRHLLLSCAFRRRHGSAGEKDRGKDNADISLQLRKQLGWAQNHKPPAPPPTHPQSFADTTTAPQMTLRPRHCVKKNQKVTQQASPCAARYLPSHKLIPGNTEASRRVKPNMKNNQTDLWEETQLSGRFLTA